MVIFLRFIPDFQIQNCLSMYLLSTSIINIPSAYTLPDVKLPARHAIVLLSHKNIKNNSISGQAFSF